MNVGAVRAMLQEGTANALRRLLRVPGGRSKRMILRETPERKPVSGPSTNDGRDSRAFHVDVGIGRRSVGASGCSNRRRLARFVSRAAVLPGDFGRNSSLRKSCMRIVAGGERVTQEPRT